MAYSAFKDFPRIASDKLLRDKALNIDKNSKFDGYQRDLVSMAYKFFDKKSSGGTVPRAHKSAVKSMHIF